MRKYAIIGTKGGVGTSVLSSLLSYELSQRKKSVLLIEAETHGDLSYIFGADSRKSFREALSVFKKDKKFKGEFIYGYSSYPSKLHMIFSRTGEVWNKEYELINPFLKRIETDYEFVIFDCGHTVDERILNILDITDLILVVLKNDFLSLAQSKNLREIFKMRYYPPQKIEYIVNFYREDGIPLNEVEGILEKEVLFLLPEDNSVINISELGFDSGKDRLSGVFKDRVKEITRFVLGEIKREDILGERKETKKDIFGIFKRRKREEKEEKKEVRAEKVEKKEEVHIPVEEEETGEVP